MSDQQCFPEKDFSVLLGMSVQKGFAFPFQQGNLMKVSLTHDMLVLCDGLRSSCKFCFFCSTTNKQLLRKFTNLVANINQEKWGFILLVPTRERVHPGHNMAQIKKP